VDSLTKKRKKDISREMPGQTLRISASTRRGSSKIRARTRPPMRCGSGRVRVSTKSKPRRKLSLVGRNAVLLRGRKASRATLTWSELDRLYQGNQVVSEFPEGVFDFLGEGENQVAKKSLSLSKEGPGHVFHVGSKKLKREES